MPGVIDTKTNFVEHPEVVAERWNARRGSYPDGNCRTHHPNASVRAEETRTRGFPVGVSHPHGWEEVSPTGDQYFQSTGRGSSYKGWNAKTHP